MSTHPDDMPPVPAELWPARGVRCCRWIIRVVREVVSAERRVYAERMCGVQRCQPLYQKGGDRRRSALLLAENAELCSFFGARCSGPLLLAE